MNDPQNLGLGELGQRVQAMSDPLPDSRLRPYQGVAPATPVLNGRANPSSQAAQSLEAYEHPQAKSEPPTPMPWPAPFSQQPYPPAEPAQSASPMPYTSPGLSGPGNSSPIRETLSPWQAVPPRNPAPNQPAMPPASAPPPQTGSPAASYAPGDPNAPKTGIQRAFDALRSTIPLVQKLLPLIDGNIASAVGALMAPHAHPAPPPQPAQVRVDLEPVERGLAEVRNSNRELRNQIAEQATQFKRVEDQLDRVREATDRNTLEQQELVEDLRTVGSRISTFAMVGLLLLAISLGLNIYLIVQLQHILR
jgi:hypothetical protein